MKIIRWTFLWPVLFLLAGCVSKKRYLTETAALREDAAAEQTALLFQLDTSATRIYRQELKIAELTGANAALFATQDKLQDRIDALQAEIEGLRESSQAREQSLDAELQSREALIRQKEQEMQELGDLLERQNAALRVVADSARIALTTVDSLAYSIELTRGAVSISLTEALLFRPGSTTRLKAEGADALARISQVLTDFPSLKIWVIGHTDNRPVPRSSIEDNWVYSVLRAATVVQLLTQDYDISTSRITAAGKGEFAPRASNETEEGRARNRRIEILIRPDEAELERAIRRRLP